MKTANFGELENMNVSSDDYHVGFALIKGGFSDGAHGNDGDGK